jgi:hypothetical protein
MRKLENAIIYPRFYAIWAVLVVVALTATYFEDPYIFAFTTFGLAGISAVICLIGLSVALSSKAASSRAKAWIIASVTAAVAASAVAFAILGSFKWA